MCALCSIVSSAPDCLILRDWSSTMATRFDDYISEVEKKAKAGGPEALARWDALNAYYAMAREVRELRKGRWLR